MARVLVKERGERSLMVRVRSGVGSWAVDLRMVVRGGRREGRREGMLSSEKGWSASERMAKRQRACLSVAARCRRGA